jgi:hypothetical protein
VNARRRRLTLSDWVLIAVAARAAWSSNPLERHSRSPKPKGAEVKIALDRARREGETFRSRAASSSFVGRDFIAVMHVNDLRRGLMRSAVAATVLALLVFSSLASAGTLCGTVRDASTNAPIAGAGVFLRHPAGGYAGYSGGTAADGTFCIDSVPAGTYDLEVLRDDYMVAYLRGVVVNEGAVDVSVPAGATVALAAPAPNPARGTTRLAWTLPAASPLRLRVFDTAGRFVRGWSGEAPAGAGAVTWDLRDAGGRIVPAGTYHLRLEAAGVVRTRRVTCVR